MIEHIHSHSRDNHVSARAFECDLRLNSFRLPMAGGDICFGRHGRADGACLPRTSPALSSELEDGRHDAFPKAGRLARRPPEPIHSVWTTLHPFTPTGLLARLVCRHAGHLKPVASFLIFLVLDLDNRNHDPHEKCEIYHDSRHDAHEDIESSLDISAAAMSSPYTQLSLFSPVEELKKSCICEIDGERCAGRRQLAKNEKKWVEYYEDMILYWDALDGVEERNGLARKFAEHSVCRECKESGRYLQVQAEFLREKGFLPADTPSYRQHATSAQATSSTATRSRRAKKASPEACTAHEPSSSEYTSDEPAVQAKQDVEDGFSASSPASAACKFDRSVAASRPLIVAIDASSETFKPTLYAGSPSRDSSSSTSSSSTDRFQARTLPVRRRLFSSDSEEDTDSSRAGIPLSPSADPSSSSVPAGTVSTPQEQTSDHGQRSASPHTSTITAPVHREITAPVPAPVSAPAPAPALVVVDGFQGWRRDVCVLVLGGLIAISFLLMAFIIWAASRTGPSIMVINKREM